MNTLDYVIVAVYLLGFLGMGYFFKDNKDSSELFSGGAQYELVSLQPLYDGHPTLGHWFCAPHLRW